MQDHPASETLRERLEKCAEMLRRHRLDLFKADQAHIDEHMLTCDDTDHHGCNIVQSVTFMLEASSALIASREAVLREALAAARDTLAAFQKQAGVIPGQGISATMTEAEVRVARAVADIDQVLEDTALIASQKEAVCRNEPDAAPTDGLIPSAIQPRSAARSDATGLVSTIAFVEEHIAAHIESGDEYSRGWNAAMHNVRNKLLEVASRSVESEPRQVVCLNCQARGVVLKEASSGAGGETASPVERAKEDQGLLRSYGPSLSDGPEASAQRPSQDDIDRLEKAAWDSKTDQVLVWYRDRLDQHAAALDAAWQDLQDWCKTARGMRERSREPKGPNFDPACPSVACIEKTEVVIRQIGAALTAADLGLCPTCGRDLRGSFPECIDCQVVTALKGGGDGD